VWAPDPFIVDSSQGYMVRVGPAFCVSRNPHRKTPFSNLTGTLQRPEPLKT
jgi:hypothetical protein